MLCCGPWAWHAEVIERLLVNTHVEPGARKPRLGGSFLCAKRGAKPCCVFFPSIPSSLSPRPRPLGCRGTCSA